MPYSVKNINAAKAHGWRTVLVGTTDRDSGLPLQVSTAIVSIAIVRTAKVRTAKVWRQRLRKFATQIATQFASQLATSWSLSK